MKKLLFLLFLLFTSTAWGADTTLGNGTFSGISINSPNPLGIEGLTFYVDYTDGYRGADADFSIGSPTATFTVTRSATNPATYINATGVILTNTTSNVPRFSYGYYDENGWRNEFGLLAEAQVINRCLYSVNLSQSAWIKDNMTISADSVILPNGATSTVSTLTANTTNAKITIS